MLFIAIDDHARIAFTAMHPDEKKEQAVIFLDNAIDYYAKLGVTVKRLLTDNGSAFRSHDFRAACARLWIKHQFTRAYRPQTNGKAERFIQSALREWAYGWTYQHSAQRTSALASWQHHDNCHRQNGGIGGVPPISKISLSGNKRLDASQLDAQSSLGAINSQPIAKASVSPHLVPTLESLARASLRAQHMR